MNEAVFNPINRGNRRKNEGKETHNTLKHSNLKRTPKIPPLHNIRLNREENRHQKGRKDHYWGQFSRIKYPIIGIVGACTRQYLCNVESKTAIIT